MAAILPERDAEAQRAGGKVSYLRVVFDANGITRETLDYPYSGHGTEESPYVVDFLPADDAWNPIKFTESQKWFITVMQALAAMAVAFVSTAYSGGMGEVAEDFGVSTEVGVLGISLFVLGFAIGPLMWAPLSEFFGRRILFIITYMALAAFSAGAAGAQNIQTLIILRFFAGAFGSSPLTNAGGVIADMFQARSRGLAMAVFASAPFLGPSIGPIVGGFLGETEGWRWIEGLMAIFTGVLWIVCIILVPETYAPVLLRRRAEQLSKLSGKAYVSKMDLNNRKSMAEQFRIALSRPWLLLFREPIVFLLSLYMAVVYGTLYMMFAAFPIVFQELHGWSPGIGGLAFVGVAVGMMAAVGYAIWDNKRFARVVEQYDGMAPPEARLPPAIIGSVLLPVGLFWFAWTNGLNVHWAVPIVASGFFAMGLVLVFLSLMNYLIDSYVVFAASALAANSVMRSLFGAAFPLFTTAMYQNLGIHWASSIPAFLALACMPFPVLFYMYGARIRMRCVYAAEAAKVLEQMRSRQVDIDETEAEAEVEAEIKEERLQRIASRASRASRTSRASRAAGRHVVSPPPPATTDDDEGTIAVTGSGSDEYHPREKDEVEEQGEDGEESS